MQIAKWAAKRAIAHGAEVMYSELKCIPRALRTAPTHIICIMHCIRQHTTMRVICVHVGFNALSPWPEGRYTVPDILSRSARASQHYSFGR